MDPELKSILRGLSLKLRHLLEGYYDEEERWHPGDLERRLNEIGIWRDRDPKPIDELPHLSEEDLNARKVLDAYLQYRKEAGASLEESVAEFVRESAYTWANRLFALRCMEARGLIDEIILQKEVYGWRSLQHNRLASKHPELCTGEDDGLFQVIFQEFERRSKELPQLFNPRAPAVALRPSVAALKKSIALLSGREPSNGYEFACDAMFEAPDAFGWAYQYWNEEEKNRVFEKVRTAKAKIEGTDIIPTTCIYTEPYMVKFLVQNSLGALWMGLHPESKLIEKWEYYIEDVDRAPADTKTVSEITFLDPACGSGHFLLEAFNIFYDMYLEEGTFSTSEEICASILNNNVFGIDLDERAVQISIAALWMKAKEKAPKLKATDLSIFHYHLVATNIQLPKDKGHLETFLNEHPEDQPLRAALDTVLKGLTDAHELGSLLQIEEPVEKELQNLRSNLRTQRTLFGPKTDEDWETWRRGVVERLKKHFVTEAAPSDLAQFFFSRSASKGLVLLDLLSRRYDVVATNPPYMGSRNFGNTIHTYLKDFYADGKNDLYGAFVIRLGYLLKRKGVFAMVTQQSWLFLAQYRPLRRSFLKQRHMELLVHLGPHAFQEISGAKANVIVFVARNETSSAESLAIRLTAFGDPLQKALALRNTCRGESALMYHFQQSNFKTLPGLPFAYWMPRKFYEAFSLNAPLGKYFENYNFTKTGNKNRFLRYFWEAPTSPRWIWLTKGGTYCKWIGNEEFEIDWSAGACAHYRNDPIGRITEEKWWYLPGITYTTNASKGFSARHNQGGGVFDYNGPCLSAKGISNDFLLGILNSRTFNFMVRFICGPLAIVIGDIKRVPSPSDGLGNDHKVSQLERLVKQCCKLKDYLTSQELHERRCNPLVFYGMSTEERLELNLAVEAFLASLEGEVEHTVLELYRFSDEDLCEIIRATGTPSSWFPLIQDYDASPLLSELLTEMPEAVFKYVKRPERCVLSRKELVDLKGRLRALYVAGYGSKFESFEADNVIVRGEDKKEVEMGARIPISSETFLEELANKLKVHPISVYWLLKEGIEQEHWRCFSKERCMITDLLSMTILRLLGHRWPKQIEAGELVPDWADPDGIIPLTEGTGEPTLLDRVHGRILEDFEGSDVTAIEHEFADIVGKPLDEWLTTEFFKHHTKQFKKRPIAWQIESRLVTSSRSGQGRRRTSRSFSGPAFSCIVYYHRLDDDLMPKIRSQYVGPLRVRYETELRTLENIKTPSADQTERRVTLEILIEELKEFDAKIEEVISNGFDSLALSKVVAQEPLDKWTSIDGEAPPPSTRDLFHVQEKAYNPDLNDGVRVNIAPLQKAGLLASEVLSKKEVDRAIRDRVEWRGDERRWCREGKLPQPGWWKTKGECA